MASDVDVHVIDLRRLFSAFDSAKPCQMPVRTQRSCNSNDLTTDAMAVKRNHENSRSRHSRNVEVMRQCYGFAVERRPSTLKHGGTGVLVTHGAVLAGAVTSVYPGKLLGCYYELFIYLLFSRNRHRRIIKGSKYSKFGCWIGDIMLVVFYLQVI